MKEKIEKAIKFFQDMEECTYGNLEEVDMAIKALENQKSVIKEKEYRMKVDEQFKCKDCDNYNLCEYYHNRRETSSICKEFRNQWGFIEELEKIKAEIKEEEEKGIYYECEEWIEGRPCDEDYFYGLKRAIMIIDKHISELKGEQE